MSSFIFTCGDINGIGPEIALKSINHIAGNNKKHKFIFICPLNIFYQTISKTKPKFRFEVKDFLDSEKLSSHITILSLPDFSQTYGRATISSGRAAYSALKLSYNLLIDNKADAVITAPVSKTALHLAGINYPGQTEMFADWSGEKNYVMTFFSGKLNVALYSIHIPLKNVSKQLNPKRLFIVVKIISASLLRDFGIRNPKISVLGLNPHAGEFGIIGKEEIKILTPFIKKYSKKFSLSGPFSPDAFFANKKYLDFDMVLGLYHDQVLIPFKFINQLRGVNYTAGLKIVRTSPDHGVAYDIAGKNLADPSSMIDAFFLAEKILKNRNLKGGRFKI